MRTEFREGQTSPDSQYREPPWSWGGWYRCGTDVAHGYSSQDTDIGAMFRHPLLAPGEVEGGNPRGRWGV